MSCKNCKDFEPTTSTCLKKEHCARGSDTPYGKANGEAMTNISKEKL